MEMCFFHFMPYQQLPDNFEKDYHSVRVDAPGLSATGKSTWPIPDRGLKCRAYRIKAPTLILWGDNDRINPPSYADDFQRLISDSKITTLPNAGHLEQPKPSPTRWALSLPQISVSTAPCPLKCTCMIAI